MLQCSSMYASMQLADAYDSTYACSRSMEASKQYHGSMHVAVEVTSRSMEHAGKQQVIATEPMGAQVVVAIQQRYKRLYKSCSEAKQNNAQV